MKNFKDFFEGAAKRWNFEPTNKNVLQSPPELEKTRIRARGEPEPSLNLYQPPSSEKPLSTDHPQLEPIDLSRHPDNIELLSYHLEKVQGIDRREELKDLITHWEKEYEMGDEKPFTPSPSRPHVNPQQKVMLRNDIEKLRNFISININGLGKKPRKHLAKILLKWTNELNDYFGDVPYPPPYVPEKAQDPGPNPHPG